MADESAPIYVSPDGQEMPVRSAERRINLEHRGWKPKGDAPAAMTGPVTEETTPRRQTSTRRESDK